jgi:hypothetical protein
MVDVSIHMETQIIIQTVDIKIDGVKKQLLQLHQFNQRT